MSVASPRDVAGRMGRDLTPEETGQATVLLGDAELILRSRIPDLLDQVQTGKIDRAAVVMVEATMVSRVLRNPEGYTQESDGNYSYMVSTAVASGRLTVLDDEWALLGVRNSVFVIAPRLDIPAAHPGWRPPRGGWS